MENLKNLCFSQSSTFKTVCVKVVPGRSFHDHRFSVGHEFIPKAVKRIFEGPAGLILDKDSDDVSTAFVSEEFLANYQNDSGSQSSLDELFQSLSWRKLKEEVSSNSSFLSIVKHISIYGVLKATSKKRLPKHFIVPVLCVYIKEFNDEVCEFIDDTGEVNGKIDQEVLQLYGDFIKSGTSLVLKQVTFLCNVLLLRKENILSFCMSDGSVQHVQDWEVVTKKESPTSLNYIHKYLPIFTEEDYAENFKKTLAVKPRLDMNNKFSSINDYSSLNVVSRDFSTDKMQNLDTNSLTNQEFETDLMDDFDELLGNLDEKSFLEEF